MIAQCTRDCYDSGKARYYVAGDQDEIDPLSSIAAYFDFPVGTRVYFKKKGSLKKNTPNIEGYMIVGDPSSFRPFAEWNEKTDKIEIPIAICSWCKREFKNDFALTTHQRTCKEKPKE
jgi:hypothetical protein